VISENAYILRLLTSGIAVPPGSGPPSPPGNRPTLIAAPLSPNLPRDQSRRNCHRAVKFEFRFHSDDLNDPAQAGWYLDDVNVTVP